MTEIETQNNHTEKPLECLPNTLLKNMLFHGSHAFYERAAGGWAWGATGITELAARGPQRSPGYKGRCLPKPRPPTRGARPQTQKAPFAGLCLALFGNLIPIFRGQLTSKIRGQKSQLLRTQQPMLSCAWVCLEIHGSRKIFKYKNIFFKVMSLNNKTMNTFSLATQLLGSPTSI